MKVSKISIFTKSVLLLLSCILLLTLFSCDKAEDNSDNSSETSTISSEENHSEEDSSATESTSEESEQTSSDELSKISNDESIATVSSINDIEDFEKLGLKKDDYQYLLIKAFLDGDTATMEEMGGFRKGVFDAYKTLKIGDYSIHLNENSLVLFTFNVTESELETMPKGQYTYMVETGIGTCFLPINHNLLEYTSIQKAIYYWIIMSGGYTFIDPDTLDEAQMLEYRRMVTDYILCMHDQINLDQFKKYALNLFNINDLNPPEGYKSDNGFYSLPPRGGSSWSHEFISETEDNGITTVTIQFYADWIKTIKSHVIEYKLKNADGDWIFISSEYVNKSQFEPAHYSL